jgi:hypothetical protein
MIESKFIEVTDTQMEDLGLDWSSMKGLTGSATLGRTDTTTYDNNLADVRPDLPDDFVRVAPPSHMEKFRPRPEPLATDDRGNWKSNPTTSR